MNATMQWCETASTTQNFFNKQEFISMIENKNSIAKWWKYREKYFISL